MLDYEVYERWFKKYELDKERLERITAINFYYRLCEEISRVIVQLIKLDCECYTEDLPSVLCTSCSLLAQTGVNHADTCLDRYLTDSLAWIDYTSLCNELHSSINALDVEYLDTLASFTWRTRNDISMLCSFLKPFFGIRRFDKRRLRSNLVNSIVQVCEENGRTTSYTAGEALPDSLSQT